MQAPRLVRRRDEEAVCPLDFWPRGRLRDGPQWSQECRSGGGLDSAISLCAFWPWAGAGGSSPPPPGCRAARAQSWPRCRTPWPGLGGRGASGRGRPTARRTPAAGPQALGPLGPVALHPVPQHAPRHSERAGNGLPRHVPLGPCALPQFGLDREQPKAARRASRPGGGDVDVDVRIRELIHAPPRDAPQSPLPMVVDPEAILRKLVFRVGISAKGGQTGA